MAFGVITAPSANFFQINLIVLTSLDQARNFLTFSFLACRNET